ncbi:MAG: hypothetical protein QOC85_3744, partial [Streptomyces sp.]|nr:hypothetical protein [Streptomyces sp.]
MKRSLAAVACAAAVALTAAGCGSEPGSADSSGGLS